MSLTGHRRWCRSSWWPDHLRNWGTSWSEKVSNMGLRKTDYDARRRDKLFVRCHGITFTSLAFPLAVTVSLIFARQGQGTQSEDIGCISSVQHRWMIFSSEQSQSCRPPFVILVKKKYVSETFQTLEAKKLTILIWTKPNPVVYMPKKIRKEGVWKLSQKKGGLEEK